ALCIRPREPSRRIDQGPCALAPVLPAPGSPSDPLAPFDCGVAPGTATADRSSPVGPAFGHRTDRLSDDFLRSSARCAHGLRSLPVPTHSTTGSPTANASLFPARSGCAASLRILPSLPSVS